MSSESDPELEDPDWERPMVFPVFHLPTRLATSVSWALMAAVALAIVAAVVNAVSYRQAVLPGGVVDPAIRLSQPTVGFADRVSLFVNGAGNLTVALLVVIAVTIIGMATRQAGAGSAVKRWRALLVVTCVVGSVVLLANVAQAIVILSDATGRFTAQLSTNKVADILALLPPALAAAGALVYAVNRFRSAPEPPGR